MKTLKQLIFLVILSFALTSCLDLDDDEDKDKIVQVTVFVSSEVGTYRAFEESDTISPHEGMQYREKGDSEWDCAYFGLIEGFAYEQGYEYELLVEKTILANPPQDSRNFTYKLIKIVSKVKAE